jgi:hypothetical protein
MHHEVHSIVPFMLKLYTRFAFTCKTSDDFPCCTTQIGRPGSTVHQKNSRKNLWRRLSLRCLTI